MLYIDYYNDVVAFYRMGQANATLPQRLMHPTPASIREECLAAYKRLQNLDLRTLMAFFPVGNDRDKIERAIENCDLDRFKPLLNLMRRDTKTNHVNIELLAWLIDFPGRPFNSSEHRILSQNDLNNWKNSIRIEKAVSPGSGDPDIANENRSQDNIETAGDQLYKAQEPKGEVSIRIRVKDFANRYKRTVVILAIMFSALGGFYMLRNLKTFFPNSNISRSQQSFVQCKQITHKGTRCLRRAQDGREYCWQHGK